MRDIPRLCTDDMVRNILSGAQTQDRWPLKPQPQALEGSWYWLGGAALERVGYGADYVHTNRDAMVRAVEAVSPRVGDRLWVRECWGHDDSANHTTSACWYRADGCYRCAPDATVCEHGPARWRPSIHMPRWACRTLLPITRVWVERIQEISEEDARAEGVERWEESYKEGFRRLWNELYPNRQLRWMSSKSGDRGPWVLCVAWDKPGVAR